MAYDDKCGMCDAPITDSDWVEADGCNLCGKCFRGLMGDDEPQALPLCDHPPECETYTAGGFLECSQCGRSVPA